MRPLVLIGYDPHEDLAYRVCKASLERGCCGDADILPLRKASLEAAGLYRRPMFMEDGQRYDGLDGKPFSTEFSFTRFLAPTIARLMDRERVLFVDSDFLFRGDVCELFEMGDPRKAVQVVKHDYRPDTTSKMRDGVKQDRYNRKLWSALMLMNVPRCHLTPFQVNTMPGSWLHQFGWLEDGAIGELPESWHWVPDHSPFNTKPLAVHYTEGTPDVPGHEDDALADEWLALAEEVK